MHNERKKDVPFLCCVLNYVGNVCERFKKMEKVPVDVLCSNLASVLIVQNPHLNKTSMMFKKKKKALSILTQSFQMIIESQLVTKPNSHTL